MKSKTLAFCLSLFCLALPCANAVPPFGPEDARITIVVMDPLSSPLACDCVQGYAQRKYEELAKSIEKSTKLSARVVWAESLETVVKNETKRIDLVIGKDSVIKSQAAVTKLELKPIASLTDKKGLKHQTGMFVVTSRSKAASMIDIEGFEVLFGPAEAEEKCGAAKRMLNDLELKVNAGETCQSCSIAAKKILADEKSERQVAVISSYAAPLLEGCGTIKKGDLKVIGETEPVPFITVFANKATPAQDVQTIEAYLWKVKESPELLAALESRDGFVPYDWSKSPAPKTEVSAKKKN